MLCDPMLGALGVNKSEHFEQERTSSLLNVRKTTIIKFQRILENHFNIKRRTEVTRVK